jgi:hypothetical protein
MVALVAASLLMTAASQATAESLSKSVRRISDQVKKAPATIIAPRAALTDGAVVPPIVTTVAEPIAGKNYYVGLNAADEKILTAKLNSLPSVQAQGAGAVTFPGIVRQQALDGSEVQLKPYILIGQRLRRVANMFSGTIKVGVADVNHAAGMRALSAPIIFEVLEGSMAKPSEVTVTQVSPPYKEISIAGRSAMGGITIHVVSAMDPQGIAVTIPVEPAIQVGTARSVIDGLGLEDVAVQVSVIGLDKPKGTRVRLSAIPSGYIASPLVTLDEDGMATTTIRSAGLGRVTIRAAIAQLSVAETSLTFQPPILTVMASLVGGGVGGLIRLLPKRKRTGENRRWFGALAVALLVGFMVFAMYVVGINVLPVEPSVNVGAVLVFVISALGAYFGTALFNSLSPRAMPHGDQDNAEEGHTPTQVTPGSPSPV